MFVILTIVVLSPTQPQIINNMDKSTLIKLVAKQSGESIETTTKVIATVVKIIPKMVAMGEPIIIRNFGAFERRLAAERRSYSFDSKSVVIKAPKYVVKFKAGKDFIDLLGSVNIE